MTIMEPALFNMSQIKNKHDLALRVQKSKTLLYGFSLVELLVVLGVIVILMGVSLFGLSSSRTSARDTRRKADLESIRSGLELYRADCRFYPATLAAGTTLTGDGSSPGCASSNIYIQTVPSDPVAGRLYGYTRLSNFTYELCTSLESGGATTSCTASCGSGVTCNLRITNP